MADSGAEQDRVVVVKMMGGLGNQLFQYAFGRQLSSRHQCRLWLDTAWFERSDERSFVLSQFKVSADYAETFVWNERPSARLIRRVRPLRFGSEAPRRIVEGRHGFDANLLRIRPSCYVEGYVHSYKYLEGLRPALMTEVSIPGEDTQVLDGYVSVHIRRGDFVSSATEQLVGIEWYSAAIAAMDDAMGPLTPLVFTDDIEWVAKNLRLPGGRQVEFGSSIRSSPVEDFQYMRRCASHIVSRSTFSWWAAWCRHDPSGLVIAPSGWQYAEVAIDDDIYPPDWTRLSAARV